MEDKKKKVTKKNVNIDEVTKKINKKTSEIKKNMLKLKTILVFLNIQF